MGSNVIFVKKRVLKTSFYKYILPEVITEHFDIIRVQELGEIKTKQVHLEIFLEEKNTSPQILNQVIMSQKDSRQALAFKTFQ